MISFERLLGEARRCDACAESLPMTPRPVFQASATARLVVASQAPGLKVQKSGFPFSDRSGDRLREWTGMTPAAFYDATKVAILPMGFCYPGRGKGGDAPPRPECAPRWRARILAGAQVRLTLLVGSFALNAALGPGKMSERVRRFHAYLPELFPLPHPSWRSQFWIDRNPWFETEVLPALRLAVEQALSSSGT